MKEEGFDKSVKPQAKVFGADIYACFPDGKVKQITPGDGIYVHPCVHPQGNEVVFYGAISGASRVRKANLATGEIITLTGEDSTADNAGFSWDGEKIVFCSDRASGNKSAEVEDVVKFPPSADGIINIFTMDADGGNVRQVTSGSFQDQRPCISPDGKSIAFVSNRGGEVRQFRLWLVAADGSEEPRMLQKEGLAYRPWFSKDGRSIYFFTDMGGRQQVCKISVETGEIVPFANDDKGDSRGPFTDPLEDVLLVHSNRGGLFNIWKIPLDGVSPMSLMQPPGFEKATHPTRAKNGVVTFDVWRVAREMPGPR